MATTPVSEGHAEPPAWWARLLIALGLLALLAVDPLNAGSASSQRSEQAVLRIASPFYDASGAVTVVLVDDAYLRRVDSGWPLPYREQGMLLRRILAHEPAALYVDLLYRHRHGRATPGDAVQDDPLDLLKPLPGATDRPTPVWFAALSVEQPPRSFCSPDLPAGGTHTGSVIDAASIEPTLRAPFGIDPPAGAPVPDLRRAGPQPRAVAVSWAGCGGAYPLLLAGSREAPTPAMALFDATCRRQPQRPACQLGGKTPLEVAARFTAPMTVRWGAFAPGSQQPFYADKICQLATDAKGGVPFAQRVLKLLQQLALGALFPLRDKQDPELALPCPAVPVLRADAILDGDPALVEALLRDRAVLLGASISGIPDWQPSAVHGLVPGVVLHAMALDNLLVSGSGYLRPLTRNASRAIMILLVCGVALFAPRIVARKPWLRERTRAATGALLWATYAIVLLSHGLVLQACAVLGMALAFDLIKPAETWRLMLLFTFNSALALAALALGRTPWNWIGLTIVVLGSLEALRGYLKAGAPKPFPHPESLAIAAWSWLRARGTAAAASAEVARPTLPGELAAGPDAPSAPAPASAGGAPRDVAAPDVTVGEGSAVPAGAMPATSEVRQ